jgi:WhiB family transcriptional regulator, redox-sensing transcriptional regulator
MSQRGTAAPARDGRLTLIRQRGACRGADPGLFFGVDGEAADDRGKREADAAAVCSQCPVRAKCLGYAVDRPEGYGFWGGMGEEERRRERRRRLRRAQARRTAA